MKMTGYCSECKKFVYIEDSGDCQFGHSKTSVSYPHQKSVQKPIKIDGRVPPEIKKWNWGAFVLPGLWGLGNNVYYGLLGHIPYIGLIMCVYLGIHGNEVAWKSKQWESLEEFNHIQEKWKVAGFVVLGFFIFILTIGILANIGNFVKYIIRAYLH